ncbi:unnamed protein product, partial [Ectocarpus fasciculatus]
MEPRYLRIKLVCMMLKCCLCRLFLFRLHSNLSAGMLLSASLTRAAPAPHAAFGHSFNRCGSLSIMGEHSATYWCVRERFGWGAAALFIVSSSRVPTVEVDETLSAPSQSHPSYTLPVSRHMPPSFV